MIDIYHELSRDISSKLINISNTAMKMGKSDSGIISLQLALRFRLLGGYKLSMIAQSFDDWIKLAVSDYSAPRLYLLIEVIKNFSPSFTFALFHPGQVS